MPPKTITTCNWVPSIVTENTLQDFVKTGYLPKKTVMHYRAPSRKKRNLNQKMMKSLSLPIT